MTVEKKADGLRVEMRGEGTVWEMLQGLQLPVLGKPCTVRRRGVS